MPRKVAAKLTWPPLHAVVHYADAIDVPMLQ